MRGGNARASALGYLTVSETLCLNPGRPVSLIPPERPFIPLVTCFFPGFVALCLPLFELLADLAMSHLNGLTRISLRAPLP